MIPQLVRVHQLGTISQSSSAIEVVIAPPALYLIPLQGLVRKEILLAAQNCYFKSTGAFTGEIRSRRCCSCFLDCLLMSFQPSPARRCQDSVRHSRCVHASLVSPGDLRRHFQTLPPRTLGAPYTVPRNVRVCREQNKGGSRRLSQSHPLCRGNPRRKRS